MGNKAGSGQAFVSVQSVLNTQLDSIAKDQKFQQRLKDDFVGVYNESLLVMKEQPKLYAALNQNITWKQWNGVMQELGKEYNATQDPAQRKEIETKTTQLIMVLVIYPVEVWKRLKMSESTKLDLMQNYLYCPEKATQQAVTGEFESAHLLPMVGPKPTLATRAKGQKPKEPERPPEAEKIEEAQKVQVTWNLAVKTYFKPFMTAGLAKSMSELSDISVSPLEEASAAPRKQSTTVAGFVTDLSGLVKGYKGSGRAEGQEVRASELEDVSVVEEKGEEPTKREKVVRVKVDELESSRLPYSESVEGADKTPGEMSDINVLPLEEEEPRKKKKK